MTRRTRRAPQSPRRGMGEAGFTLVELLIVVVIISIVVGIVQPNLQKAVLRARATSVIGDMQVVRVAVLSYQAENHNWPPDHTRGQVPPDLEPYLPEGFSFSTQLYSLDFDNWTQTGPFDVGITMITSDRNLGWTVLDMLGPNAEIIAPYTPATDAPAMQARKEEVLAMLRRRPCTLADIADGLSIHHHEASKYVQALLNEEAIRVRQRLYDTYYEAAMP